MNHTVPGLAMIQQVIHQGSSYLNGSRLTRQADFLRHWERDKPSIQSLLQEPYERYVSGVSKPEAAISLELAVLLYFWCLNTHPSSILGLGSGFSEYVFHLYRQREQTTTRICSVDTEVEWMNKTRLFCGPNNTPQDQWLLWREFQENPGPSFDLILMDLGGGMAFRVEALEWILHHQLATGPLFLDDMHKSHYRNAVRPLLKRPLWETYDLRSMTRDRFHRSAWLALPLRERKP